MYVVLATSIEDNWRRLCKSDASCFGLVVGQWSLFCLLLISGKRNERSEMEHGKRKRVRSLKSCPDKTKPFDGVVTMHRQRGLDCRRVSTPGNRC